MWTRFMDMHSGGGLKEPPYSKILIEAPEHEARSVFFARFGHSASRVTCTCCGEDYSVSESETLEQATGYDRGCRCEGDTYLEEPDRGRFAHGPYRTLTDYLTDPDVLVIRADEIRDEERATTVPEQGYVWR